MSAIVVATLDPGAPGLAEVAAAAGAEVIAVEALDGRLATGTIGGLVVMSDGLDSDVAVVVAGLLADGPPAVEVRSGRWDGFGQGVLTSACLGVIAGFGLAGVSEAIRWLREEER